MSVTPGADNIAFLKQARSFGMDKSMKLAQPLLWISYLKEGGPELYADIYGLDQTGTGNSRTRSPPRGSSSRRP